MCGAESNRHQTHTFCTGLGSGSQHIFCRLERLTVGHEHESAVGTAVAGQQEFGALTNCAGDRAAGLPDHRRIEVFEEEFNRPVVTGERRQDVAASGKGDQGDAIGLRHRAQSSHLLLHPFQAGGALIGRHHGKRCINGDCHIDAARAHRPTGEAPSRPRQGKSGEERHKNEPNGASAFVGVREHDQPAQRRRLGIASEAKAALTHADRAHPPHDERQQHGGKQ